MILSGHRDRLAPGVAYYHEFHPRYLLLSGGYYSPRVSWGDLMMKAAVDVGIPASVCVVEDTAHSTYSNFENMMPIIRQRQLQHVVVVTSWYHTRRSRWVADHFEQKGKDLHFYVLPADDVPSLRRRLQVDFLVFTASEWGKMVWYGIRHGLWFPHA
jgi:uncharacterized SAM-binding protein YcdF (DUF218 family)